MAMSESAPRAAVALKELARKNEASSGTLRIMGLLLSSVSTCAPGRLDLRGRRERPDLRKVDIPPHRHYERWDATGLLFLVKPTSAGPSKGRSSCPRGPTRAKPVCSGLAAGRKGASTGCATRADAAGRLQYPKEGGSSGATCLALATQVSQRNADPTAVHKEETHEDGEAHVPAHRHDAGVRGRFGGCSNAGAGGAAAAPALRPPDHPRAGQ